ncbi:MAG: trypsin-like serine protease [Alphaproteobacteria bacterium]
MTALRFLTKPAVFCAALMATLWGGGPNGEAWAVVKGAPDPSLERHVVMVLDNRGNVCSGVVLTQNVILTAAHCIASASAWRVHWRAADNTPILVEPKYVRVHPEYDSKAIKKRVRSVDLAVVVLNDPLPNQFTPIGLAITDTLPAGETVIVGGYGLSEEKKPKALGKFLSAALSVVEPYGPSRFVLWLQDTSSTGAGGCHGDSGGPMFAQGTVIAIIAWTTGPGKSDCGEYTQGTLIAPHREWIEKAAGFNQ